MKLSEFIARLKELKAIHGGDPEVAIESDEFNGTTYYETAGVELQSVQLIDGDSPYLATSKDIMSDDSPQIVVVF